MTRPPELPTGSDPSTLFAAQGAFAADLATFQAMQPTCASYATEDVLRAFAPAHQLGFAYSISQGIDSVQVSLLHRSGWDRIAAMEEGHTCSPWELLAGLAGICMGDGTAAAVPESPMPAPSAVPAAVPASAAAAQPAPSAPAASVAPPAEPDEFGDEVDPIGPGTPDGPTNPEDRQPLSESDRETCLAMLRALTPEQRKEFTVAFRSHFNIGRESRIITPHIVQVQHQRFIQLFIDELELSGAAAA